MKLGVVSQNGRTHPLFYHHTDLSILTGWLVGQLVSLFTSTQLDLPCIWPCFFINESNHLSLSLFLFLFLSFSLFLFLSISLSCSQSAFTTFFLRREPPLLVLSITSFPIHLKPTTFFGQLQIYPSVN